MACRGYSAPNPGRIAMRPYKCSCCWRSPLQLSRIALAVTLLVLLAWAACGGGAVVTHTPGTPAGTYTITLTATDPQAGLTQTATANLTVNP